MLTDKKKIMLIFGGRSSEHEVSLNSAKNIYNAIDKNKFDVLNVGISKTGTWHLLSKDQLMNSAFLTDEFLDNLSDNASVSDSEDISADSLEKNKKSQVVALISYLSNPVLIELKSQKQHKVDCVFPIIHGSNGEDGTLQGLFRIVNVPFVGCDVLGSAICMDKEYAKIIMTAAGVPNTKFLVLNKYLKNDFHDIQKKLGLPFFIKPANAGSSVGVHKIKSESDFNIKIQDSFLYDHKVIAEEFIPGQEIECAVKGSNLNPQASVVGELVVKHEFYSYEAKYLDAHGADIVIPARITYEQSEQIKKIALKAYQVLSCDGMARVDFFMQADGKLIVNEINTLPGFTQISMYPKMWEASGLKYSDLISELINYALIKFDTDSTKKQNYV